MLKYSTGLQEVAVVLRSLVSASRENLAHVFFNYNFLPTASFGLSAELLG